MKLKECTKCSLCKTRTQVVVGRGSTKYNIMLVGEAPGADEDKQGKPFVGRSGKVLDDALMKAKLLDKVYITNIVKCHPPNNRDPKPSEKEKCSMWLKKQIDKIHPNLIVCLGRHAFDGMYCVYVALIKNDPEGRNNIYYVDKMFSTVCIYKTLHPAATLYNPNLKFEFYKQVNYINKLI